MNYCLHVSECVCVCFAINREVYALYSIDNLLSWYIILALLCTWIQINNSVYVMDRIYINGFTISKKRFQFHAIISVYIYKYMRSHTHCDLTIMKSACTHEFLPSRLSSYSRDESFRNSPCHACVVTNTKRQIKLWTKIYCIWSYCDVTVEYKKIYLYIYIHTYIHINT